MAKIFAIGEPMVQLLPENSGPLRHVLSFKKYMGGAEANFCISASRLGVECHLIARVGDDEFGKYIIEYLMGKGVNVNYVKSTKGAWTAVFFVQKNFPLPNRNEVYYYRTGSAGSMISPEDVPDEIKGADLVHSTGITLAISKSASEALKTAFEKAKMTSFDTNIRLKLWSGEQARKAILSVLPLVDVLITDPGDASLIFGETDFEKVIGVVKDYGVSLLVYKLGEKGAAAWHEGEKASTQAFKVPVVHDIGAGDAFSGAFIASWLSGRELGESLRIAAAFVGIKLMTEGDAETYASLDDVKKFIEYYSKF
ncbi:sugar kinase [Sulfolobales archaeon HS-7]|nr:sugar kinase [Sulfolobales archaeon HS-7]